MQVPSLILAFALVWLAMPMARADSTPHHELDVRIDPQGHIRASDRITFDGTKVRDLLVRLAPTLKFEDMQGQVAVERLGTEQGGSRVVYRLYSEQPFSELRVRYFGQIETERNDGLSWDGGDGWYPDTGADLLRFRLRVEKPDSWDVISQGERRCGWSGSMDRKSPSGHHLSHRRPLCAKRSQRSERARGSLSAQQ